MDDIDRVLRSSLREHAESTPAPVNLLGAVHQRSRQLTLRRRFTVSAATAAVLAVTGTAAALPNLWSGPAVPPADPQPASPSITAPPSPSQRPVRPSSSPSIGPSGNPSPGPTNGGETTGTSSRNTALRLAAPSFTAPTFPWRPGVTPIGGLAAPEITVDHGQVVAYYAAHDPVRGADVTIWVGPQRPSFPTSVAGRITESSQHVRGRPATLRTVHVAPAAQLSLYWREVSGRWMRVDTDDTLTDAEVVRFANELRPAALPVPTPFTLDLAPVGMMPYTISRSTMEFRATDGATDLVTCRLSEGIRRPRGSVAQVGRYSARLARTSGLVVLTVAMDDRGETLTVTVPARSAVTDSDVIRFASGITITEYAEP